MRRHEKRPIWTQCMLDCRLGGEGLEMKVRLWVPGPGWEGRMSLVQWHLSTVSGLRACCGFGRR
jgi:hypothetical protein